MSLALLLTGCSIAFLCGIGSGVIATLMFFDAHDPDDDDLDVGAT